MHKPDTRTAMRQLIDQIREAIPFDASQAQVCGDDCNACALKLLEYLDGELGAWEARLDAGETPNLGEVSRLATTGRKVHAALEKNGLNTATGPGSPNETRRHESARRR
jgi:hypothetical protein